ncbi:uncharacterized protein N0V89_012037 [Didymosphaeria variabile]|uniref:Uncharacterized protein n=1 Tax=Didymosphaeria variabile TaxID=1932322 RepID=A0A9W9C5A4_9PLEO|nr:uncharacterized protein N0V89_012037 [Didymosphaeria variabile]KAJ4345901.1 hypothetical protein N0V89_012037 [Didymosphaeria variabile]
MECNGCFSRIHGFILIRALAQRPAGTQGVLEEKLPALEILRRTHILLQCVTCHQFITVRFEPAYKDYLLESGATRLPETMWHDMEAGNGAGPNDQNHDPRKRFSSDVVERHSRLNRRLDWQRQFKRTLKWILKEERKKQEDQLGELDQLFRDAQQSRGEEVTGLPQVSEMAVFLGAPPNWHDGLVRTEADDILDGLEREDLERESLTREDLNPMVVGTGQQTESGTGSKREREDESPDSSRKMRRSDSV